MSSLDYVLIVTKSSQVRLTNPNKQFFIKLRNMFAIDLENNLFIINTHYDGTQPKSLACFQAEGFKINLHCEFNFGSFFLN